MTALKNCPFCGGEAKRFKEYGDERNGYADFVGYRCVGCHVSKGARGDTSKPGYADNSKIEERAIENWNHRAQPEVTKDNSLRTSLADLATALWRTHYRNDSPNFELLPDAAGILSQIDNMVSGLVKPKATKPAQDLSAAILALPLPDAWFRSMKRGGMLSEDGYSLAQVQELLEAAAALASPADALVADSAQPEANADAKDAGRWRFRQKLLLNGGCVLFSQRGVQFRDVHGVILCQGPTEEEAIDAAIEAQKDGHG